MPTSNLEPARAQLVGDRSDSSNAVLAEKAPDASIPNANLLKGPNEPLVDEYSHGMRLVLIMISLMLSIFLVSLDNVSDQAVLRKHCKLTHLVLIRPS
jgi:hypothetical protein